MFLAVMIAIGLFVLRFLVARALGRRTDGTGCGRCRSPTWSPRWSGLLAIAAYLDSSIATDSLRSVFDVGALVPLFRVTAFGRGYVDMLLCFALFCVAGWTALYLDRPERAQRSVAEMAAQTGALLAAAAVLLIPGRRRARRRRPRRAG